MNVSPGARLSSTFLLALSFAACSSPSLTVLAGDDSAAVATAFAAYVPNGLVHERTSADPVAALASTSGPRAALVVDLACGDCYEIAPSGGGAFVVHGGSLLGVQYGLAQLLEVGGVRFYHPRASRVPASLSLPAAAPEYGVTVTPQKSLRGLHLHTLHPIESHFDFWVPSAAHLDGAERVVDWLVKNRGNFLDWTALDDIDADDATYAAWHDHTKAILDYAHARGVQVGIEVEMFHGGDLQNGYDLLTDADLQSADTHPVLQQRFAKLVGDLPFDELTVGFGEFFGTSPDVFIQQLDNAYDALQAVRPGMEMSALVHVGNGASQHVQYMGMDILYYFLVKYANPAIVPWIHSVMYYDLFEDAGGAYQHDDFSLHRQYLLDRLAAHQPVAYYPEDAYWVAFDDSVPTYLPIYVYTRALDLAQIDQTSVAGGGDPLGAHVAFSTGWEWGYWQNDYASLRMSYQAPETWHAPIDQMFAPYGDAGAALSAQIANLATIQHDALIGKRLAAYLAGNDFLLDSGYQSGIISQPHRPSFADVAAMSASDRATYETTVLDPLDRLAADTAAAFTAVDAVGIAHDDPWYSEVHDGFAVDADRTRFIAALYRAAAVSADGGAVDDLLAAADGALADARKVIGHRHAHLHDPEPSRLLDEENNVTQYKYGYLNEADTLCYWVRERGLFAQQIQGSSETPPGCVLGF